MGDEDTIYVAVNQDVRESKSTLLWTLKTLQFNKIFLLHVHLPFSLTTSSSRLTQGEIDGIQDAELKTSYRNLYKYRDICINKGVSEENVDIAVIPEYDVGKGIVELINQNNIKKLVMGAAADPHYSRGMTVTSRKAEHVLKHGPRSCKMWFICKGKLIKTGEGSLDHVNPSDLFSTLAEKPNKERRHKTESHKEHPVLSHMRESDSSPPHEFLCPITREIMRDPHLAADGFTYEAEAFREFLRAEGGGDGGVKKKSPMTSKPLENHILIPNLTLRTIINDWLQKHPNYRD